VDDLLLDACVAINLVASGVDLNELADASSVRFVMTSVAAAEALWLTPLLPGDKREIINIEDLVLRGTLTLLDLAGDEPERFIAFAKEIDDGEAATFAVATSRGLPVATDDRRAQRLAVANVPPISVIGTTQLLKIWVDTNGVPHDRVAEVIHSVERRASYIPRRDDLHLAWWVAHRESPSPGAD
jgi:predicted nucleic acid-binding protein